MRRCPFPLVRVVVGFALSVLDTGQVDRVEDAVRTFRGCTARSGSHRGRASGGLPHWRRREHADGFEHELDDVAVGFDEELQFRLDLHVNPVLTTLLLERPWLAREREAEGGRACVCACVRG